MVSSHKRNETVEDNGKGSNTNISGQDICMHSAKEHMEHKCSADTLHVRCPLCHACRYNSAVGGNIHIMMLGMLQ